MRFWIIAGLAVCAAAQGLDQKTQLLARIKAHMSDELSRLPNYTCLETTNRFYRDVAAAGHNPKPLQPLDIVRLEVIYTDHHEWYGEPGSRSLAEDDPASFIGSGMIGNGMFGITLHNIFLTDAAMFTPHGEETVKGRAALRYDFRLPRLQRGLEISLQAANGTVGEAGSFWVDPKSLDLIRLQSHADEIPEFLPLAALNLDVDYARTRVGGGDALLPQQAGLNLEKSGGDQEYNRIAFTHCRAYSAESSVRFDDAPPAAAITVNAKPGAPAVRAPEALPALLAVTIQLTTPVSDRDTVGSLIEGRVVGDVKRRGAVAIPDGSRVHGRIRRLESFPSKEQFIAGLEFTEVEVNGIPMRFYADLLSLDRSKTIRAILTDSSLVAHGDKATISNETITLPELPGVASFFVAGKAFTLPAGFKTVWRTRGLIRGTPY